jgi:rhamnose utilization protein RhaD (predicted bifunctional aldolase and dehydrogenase)
MEQDYLTLCARWGGDSMLVQGAGGNASWKEGETLWIKASGQWLSRACDEDIFVSVSLPHLQAHIAKEQFDVVPQVKQPSRLRPSIETLLHALMPSRYVMHLHPVDALAWLVCNDAEQALRAVIGDQLQWAWVPYQKPGADLARSLNQSLRNQANARVVLMQNHGVVVAADTLHELERTLNKLMRILALPCAHTDTHQSSSGVVAHGAYRPVADPVCHSMSIRREQFVRLQSQWALWPDHVVFLGPRARTFETETAFQSWLAQPDAEELPAFVFVKGAGTWQHEVVSVGQLAQLKCYQQVLDRLDDTSQINPLSDRQIRDLLNWDAEKYRQSLGAMQ